MIERNGNELRVSGAMLMANASALLAGGRGFLRTGDEKDWIVDLSAVKEADSSALGLVFAWLRDARKTGAALRLAHPPASMISLAALYGVSDLLPLA